MWLDPTRRRLLELIADRDPPTDLKKASLAAGRNHAYLHQFINRGTPKRLPVAVRRRLADHLGVDEAALRPETPVGGWRGGTGAAAPAGIVAVHEVKIAASASGGGLADHEPPGEIWYFPRDWVHHALRAHAEDLKIITIDGDSMNPILESGDRVLVNLARRAPSPPGVFILHDGIGLVAKQLEFLPNTDPPRLVVKSANARYQDYERTIEEVNIIGRVVWFARRL